MPAYPNVKSSPDLGRAAPKCVQNQCVRIGGQLGVGVQKEQGIAARGARTSIHLQGATSGRPNQGVAKRPGEPHGVIDASAVHDDYFDAACP